MLASIPWEIIAIQTVNGIVTGMILALVASGLTLIFGIMRVINFAQGDFMMLGMYLTMTLTSAVVGDGTAATFYWAIASALVAAVIFYGIGALSHKALIGRVTGTKERPGISASFNDRDGKPLVFQLTGPEDWSDAMAALGFLPRLKEAGFEHLGVIIDNDGKRTKLLALLDDLFATGTRADWVEKLRAADIVSAPINTLLEASNDPDVLANGYVTEIDYPKYGKRLKVHGTPWQFSETPAKPGIAPGLGEHNDAVLGGLGYSAAAIADLRMRRII